MGLKGTRQQALTVEEIVGDMGELRELFPNAGIREMINHLFVRKGKKVPRYVPLSY